MSDVDKVVRVKHCVNAQMDTMHKMAPDKSKIGIVHQRASRAPSLKEQRASVKAAGAEYVYEITPDTASQLFSAVRPGDTVYVYLLALLAPPRTRDGKSPALHMIETTDAIVCKRKALLVETMTGRRSDNPQAYKAARATAHATLNRGGRDMTSHAARAMGKHPKRGRKAADFSDDQKKEARAIWYNLFDYPTTKTASAALAKIVDHRGNKFTLDRAYKIGPRSAKPVKP